MSDAPIFREGDQLSARKLNELAAPMRRTEQHPGSFKSGNELVQRRLGGRGGGSSSNTTAFGVVTQDAGADGDGIGHALLLSDDNGALEPLDSSGNVIDTDPESEYYDPYLIAEYEVAFRSAHTNSTCQVGDRVQLFGERISPGVGWEDAKVWGLHVDGCSYWEGHPSFNDNWYLGAVDGTAVYREFETDSWDGSVDGTAECQPDGSIDITITPTGGGFIFVVPPAGDS